MNSSQFFDFIEVNATFYNNVFPPWQAKWSLQDVSEHKEFVFAVKLYRGFTHTFDATAEDDLIIERFLDEFATKGKLVGVLIQFPIRNLPNENGLRLPSCRIATILEGGGDRYLGSLS